MIGCFSVYDLLATIWSYTHPKNPAIMIMQQSPLVELGGDAHAMQEIFLILGIGHPDRTWASMVVHETASPF